MKHLVLILSMSLIYSCKKDIAVSTPTDVRFGNYNCIKVTHTVSLDTLGNIINTLDTSSSTFVANIAANGLSNYNVTVDSYNFSTNTNLNNEYFAVCPSGPCSSIKFYASDSISVFRRVNNVIKIYYLGKKQ